MLPGSLLADRFEVQDLVGRGGMSSVYRAFDRKQKVDVALKLLGERYTHERERFAREAIALQGLRHPNIVKYVAHGRTDDGTHYLAMEWIEGEDLSSRLKNGALTMSESVALASRVASALAAAHARGIVHRDIKPSNIFLDHGKPDRVKLLDFGIARFGDRDGLTAPGVVFGTLGYMAPEQARGERVIDARADVFALGCVLYECITGKPVFIGAQPTAVLAKVVFEDAPRLKSVRANVPDALDRLVARMLAKVPASRPDDARALAAEIDGLSRAVAEAEEAPELSVRSEAIGDAEQRIVSVILTSVIEPRKNDATMPITTAEHDVTVSRLLRIREAAAPFDAQIELLRNGSLVATLVGKGDAPELAARAARCAMAIQKLAPEVPIVVATGRGVLGGRLPVGEVIDKAADLLRSATGGGRMPSTPPGVTTARVDLDSMTAALLDARFDVSRGGSGFILRGEREQVEATRTLLGRETPCVGRDRELSLLRMYLDECVNEPVARAVLVTAPAGFGKSRVRYEFVRSAKNSHPEAELWSCRGDPIGAGSPFAMVAQLIRDATGIRGGEPLELKQGKLRDRVARNVSPKHALRVSQFLGEIVGAKFPDDESLQLRAARQDPMLMGDQMQAAWEDFLDAETARTPVVLLLEDLHWGDLPSVQLVDAALRTSRERALMVLALARPEVHELFPRIWAGRGVQELRLGELTRKASEKLVREVLGDKLSPDQLTKLVDRAGGNAFYLEELIRSAAEGSADQMPGTVVAMVQSRLERIEPDARRVLRAASVFGQVFWRSGVMTLLGGEGQASSLDEWLRELVERETITRRTQSKFPGEEEYIFRHALVRDAAYAMLTEADTRLGHQLAAEWLSDVGEGDAMTMAEHLERGGEPVRAIDWFRRAAEHALEGNDYDAVVARCERAIACGAQGETFGVLRVMQAEAHRWRGDLAGVEACSLDAMRLLRRSSTEWFNAVGDLAVASGRRGKAGQLSVVAQMLLDLGKGPVSGAHAVASARAATQLLLAGKQDQAVQLIEMLERVPEEVKRKNPAVAARINGARYYRAICGGDPGSGVEYAANAAELFERAGDLRNACVQRGDMAYAQVELGAYEQARSTLREVLTLAERLGRLWHASATAKHNLGMVLARIGAFGEAQQVENEAMEAFQTKGDRRMEGRSRIFLAEIFLLAGDLDAANREATTAVKTLSVAPPAKAHALAVAAQVQLARGDSDAALRDATEADKLLQQVGVLDEGEAVVRLVHAEALHAAGQLEEARTAITAARDRLLERAERIRDEALRRSFLEQVPENARTLALAHQWAS